MRTPATKVGTMNVQALAAPDTPYMFEALQNCDLTVHVATKLNVATSCTGSRR